MSHRAHSLIALCLSACVSPSDPESTEVEAPLPPELPALDTGATGLVAQWTVRPESVRDLGQAGRAFGRRGAADWRLHAGGFIAELDAAGARMAAVGASDAAVQVALAEAGRGERRETLPQGAVSGVAGDDGVGLLEHDRGSLVEWWRGGTRGLEHGWTLLAAPEGDGPLSFAVAVTGAWADVSEDKAWLEGEDGTIWHVDGLAAWDATGQELSTWMEASEQGYVVRVDDTDAAYPVTVDPWYTTTSTEIASSQTSSGSYRYYSLTGEKCDYGASNCAYAYYGETVRGLGDVNSDGYDDLLVASSEWGVFPYDFNNAGNTNRSEGRFWIYHGTAAGLSTTPQLSVLGTHNQQFAESFLIDADFNGDGANELLVSAYDADPNGSDSGRITVYSGSSAGYLSSAIVNIDGQAAGERYGGEYRFDAGDIDGDGYDDLVIGVPGDDTSGTNAGKLVVYMGSTAYIDTIIDAMLYGEVASDAFGTSLAVADVNGDGYADVVVGAPGNDDGGSESGKVYVFEGSATGLSTTASHGQYGTTTSHNLGTRVVDLGDINGDGYDDVYLAGDTLDANIYLGDAGGITGTPDQQWTRADIVTLGDINDDGYDDIRIGTEVQTGTASGVMDAWADTSHLQSVGDFDGDGYTDLALGDPNYSGSRGRMWIRYGYEPDLDTDGYLASEDCDDNDASVYPGATETTGDGVDQDCDGEEVCYVDADGDGFGASDLSTVVSTDEDCDDAGEASADDPLTDCDDTVFLARPGGTELPGDGIDQDCDGADTCYADLDGDGYRSASGGLVASADLDCTDPGEATASTPATDCDDTNATISPAATETPGDGIDSDCNGGELCYVDNDDDGFSEMTGLTISSSDMDCSDPGEGSSTEPATDCDDTDASIHPGALDTILDGIDQDCDGGDACYADLDGDGYADASGAQVASTDGDCTDPGEADASVPQTDCDDSDASINPAASETIGDSVDYDCDGTEVCYADTDEDGYRDAAGGTTTSADTDCEDAGEATSAMTADDCDDSRSDVYPGAPETVGDGIDADCDGTETCYVDGDGDGIAAAGALLVTSTDGDCEDAGEAIGGGEPDCDDSDATIYPGATEIVVDGIDQDCDGGDACYADADSDGYRDSSGATVLSDDADCTDPGEADATAPATDCDDTNASINPGATELVADGVDSDCDGAELCYTDADEDGYRPVSGATVSSTDDLDCEDAGEALPAAPATDCDDSDASINPGASEAIGDEIDSDCDGGEICYVDSDGDAYRASAGTVTSSDDDCDDAGEAAASMATGDCDDADATVNPGATEIVADGIDSDCDGTETCYADADMDGFADSAGTTVASADSDCSDGGEADSSVPQTDCDDTSATAHPGATEVTADGTDQDCDGEELCLVDADGDGHAEMTGMTQASSDLSCASAGLALASQPADDCDDGAVGIFPGATESIADGIDQDCDTMELCYVDADGDGARSADGATVASADLTCTDAGEADATASADCNDADASVHPAATETPADGIDSDCDGAELCYTDYDADGFRPDEPTPAMGDLACTGPGLVGAGAIAGDCDDSDAAVNPDGTELVADGVDSDCSGTELCYVDADSDGYRPDGTSTVESELLSCAGPGVATDSAPVGDCDDSSDAIHPDQDDAAGDEVDANCDGAELCFADGDGDGFRTLDTVSSVDTDCQDPGEATVDAELVDCDDTRAGVNPGAAEIAGDGVDQDCDGSDGGVAVADSAEKDGGGCSTVPGRGGLGLVLLGGLAAVATRRRRA